MKYRPSFPQPVRMHNNVHRHSGPGMLTPLDVHHDHAVQRVEQRAGVIAAAYCAHPERFPRGLPRPPQLPTEVWLNKPVRTEASAQ